MVIDLLISHSTRVLLNQMEHATLNALSISGIISSACPFFPQKLSFPKRSFLRSVITTTTKILELYTIALFLLQELISKVPGVGDLRQRMRENARFVDLAASCRFVSH